MGDGEAQANDHGCWPPTGRASGGDDAAGRETTGSERAADAAHLRAIYAAARCGLMTIDRTGTLLDANDAAHAILGLPPKACLAARPADWGLRTPEGRPLLVPEWPGQRALVSGRPQRDVVVQMVGPDAEPRWLQIDAVPIVGRDGETGRAVIGIMDVTARVRAEQSLAHQAAHDALTGLPNRTAFLGLLDGTARSAARTQRPLALLLLDLGRFKKVNGALGHGLGDLLLRHVAERLRAAVPAPGTVAHLGGDEFAVLLPGADESSGARRARSILRALAAPLTLDGCRVDVGASIGVACAAAADFDAATLLRHADAALATAKRKRGSVAVHDPGRDRRGTNTNAPLGLLADLRHALTTGGLELHYQPVVAAATNRAVSVEALVRWPHPERGLVTPDHFIPLAEQTDLITPLTGWALETALQQERLWREAGLDLRVAVNLSMRTLHNPRLPATIADLLRRHDSAPARLTLEVTESAVMEDPEQAGAMLGRLRALGVRLAIDDFGIGHSSLGYLKRLPVDTVKIDRSFVRDLSVGGRTGDARDTALVQAIIAMAHALSLSVVAEGVETVEEWRLLRVLGCEEGQGYYLGKAMRAANLEHWVRAAPWAVA